MSIFFTDDRCPDTFCPNGWKCTSLDWPVDFSCSFTSGKCNVATGKIYLPLLTSKGFYWKSSLDTLISLSSICVVAFLLHLLFSHPSFLLPSYESITEESKKDMFNSRVNRNKCLLHKNHNVSTSWLIVGFPTTLCDNMITLILTTAPTCKSTELAILFSFYRWSVQS